MYLPLTMIALLALAPACVSKSRYEALERERDDLVRRSAGLEAKTQDIADVAAELGDELTIQEQEVAQLEEAQKALKEELEAEMLTGQIKIELMRDGLHVQLAESILFSTGSADLSPGGEEVLLSVVDEFQDMPFQIAVIGYTDNMPIGASLAARFPSNWELAGARATGVVRLLHGAGIASERLVAVSLGENNPIASNDTPEGRAENRRIDIRLRPVVP
jgi:chemotaxis protein MotB